MTRNYKIILGILSFIPLIGMIFGMSIYFSFIFDMIGHSMDNPGEPPAFAENPQDIISKIIPAVLMLFVSGLVGFGLFIYFLVCAIKDKSATENDRILWILLLVFLSYFVMPIYWYVRLWSNPDFTMKDKPEELSI